MYNKITQLIQSEMDEQKMNIDRIQSITCCVDSFLVVTL